MMNAALKQNKLENKTKKKKTKCIDKEMETKNINKKDI